ncbi:MAG: response regulator transcription factor [Deinococcales bacterium]|jgi:two-component system alkaline phosphatase synthesis response regulator PhoP
MTKTILIVDDKLSLTRLLQEYLGKQGYRTVVADNGRNALFTARHAKPDLILLDVMMPEMDGLEFIRTYRRESDTPIILLTARVEEADKVAGLELGADDYVTKPFGMAELNARVRAVLRRYEQRERSEERLKVGEVELDHVRHTVRVDGHYIDLTPSEFDLLATMMAAPGRVFSRVDLIDHLPGESPERVERTIDAHVRNLRKKLERDPRHPRYVETVFGVGYRFRPEA